MLTPKQIQDALLIENDQGLVYLNFEKETNDYLNKVYYNKSLYAFSLAVATVPSYIDLNGNFAFAKGIQYNAFLNTNKLLNSFVNRVIGNLKTSEVNFWESYKLKLDSSPLTSYSIGLANPENLNTPVARANTQVGIISIFGGTPASIQRPSLAYGVTTPFGDYRTISPRVTQPIKTYQLNTQLKNISRSTKNIGQLADKTPVVGVIDPRVFGAVEKFVDIVDVYGPGDELPDGTILESGQQAIITTSGKRKVRADRAQNLEVLRANGRLPAIDFKILMRPDFLTKTFKGGLYVSDIKKGLLPVLNFDENDQSTYGNQIRFSRDVNLEGILNLSI